MNTREPFGPTFDPDCKSCEVNGRCTNYGISYCGAHPDTPAKRQARAARSTEDQRELFEAVEAFPWRRAAILFGLVVALPALVFLALALML